MLMKKFLTYCTLFALPIIISLAILEVIVGQIPNSYSYKYNYIKTNGPQIQAIAIGHSQLYDGFKPESFCIPAFNLCNSSQNYVDNYYLIRELLKDMPNLKVVIMPIGYMSVEVTKADSSLTDRSCYYHKYMHLDYDGRVPLRYRFECFDPLRAWDKMKSYYMDHLDIIGCDSMGRRSTHYLRDRKHPLGYDGLLEKYTERENKYQKFHLKDGHYLVKTIQLLYDNNISVVLVSPPYYWDCGFDGINWDQKAFLKNYVDKLCKKFPVLYLDMESDSTFTYNDFFNETHLSEIGAEKFTRRLGEEVRKSVLHQ